MYPRCYWADVAAILAGLMVMGLAIWPVPFADAPETGRQVSVWWVYALAPAVRPCCKRP